MTINFKSSLGSFCSLWYCHRSVCVAHLVIDLGWWCLVTALLTVQCLLDRHLQHTYWTLSLTKCCKSSLNSCSSIAEPWGKIAGEAERHSGPTNPSWESVDPMPLLWWVNQGLLAIKLWVEKTLVPVAQGTLKSQCESGAWNTLCNGTGMPYLRKHLAAIGWNDMGSCKWYSWEGMQCACDSAALVSVHKNTFW